MAVHVEGGQPAHSVSCRQPSNSIATTHATFSSCTRSSSSFINSTSLPLFHASRNKQEKQKTNCFGIMPGLTIGDTIPDLVADSTHGKIKLHEYIGASWTIIFSHPGQYILLVCFLCLRISVFDMFWSAFSCRRFHAGLHYGTWKDGGVCSGVCSARGEARWFVL